jgi:outer membrane protein
MKIKVSSILDMSHKYIQVVLQNKKYKNMILKQVKRITMSAVLVAGITLPSMVKASDTISISLSKAIEIAMSKNPTIKVADKEVQRVTYLKKEREGNLLPVVSASLAYQRAVMKQKMYLDGFDITKLQDPQTTFLMQSLPSLIPIPQGVQDAQKAYYAAMSKGDGSIEVGRDNTFNGGISASMPIIAPTLWATVKMTEVELELVNENARSSRIALLDQIKKTYYQILYNQDTYNVYKQSYKNSIDNANNILQKYKQGFVPEFEWIRADVQMKNSGTALVYAEKGVSIAILQLKMLMGIDMFVNIKVEGKLSEYENQLYESILKVDTSQINSNTNLKLLDIQIKQLDHTRKINMSSLLPMLSVSFNGQYMSMVNDNQIFTNKQTWFPYATAGLSLSIPIYQGGTKINKDKQMRFQREQLELNRENYKRSLEFNYISCIENIKNAIEKIQSNKESLRQAEKALQIARKRYEVGAGTFLDLISSDEANTRTGLQYNQSIYEYLTAFADLEKLLGTNINNK